MWAVIGVYGGREDNQFYRRLDDGRIAPHTAKTMLRKDVEALGSQVVHSVRNPTREWTAAIHVYGGDFFTVKRTQWTMDTFEPTTLDPENLKKVLADAAANARKATTPGEQP
jgi:predicted metal-dependent enzyme (double-stranded beta helix superfamily)